MYKLREERLKALYAPSDAAPIAPSSPYIMEQHNTSSAKFGLSKTSVTGSHGDSLADQSFESFKTKEIRDSESPTRFGTVIPSDNSGWHVTSSEEHSADGKTHTLRSSATTEGTKDIQGGRTSFAGKNEEVSSERFEGDDKNFVRSSGDQSATFLAENTVIEGEDGSTVSKKSTSMSSSSSKVVRSQQTFGDIIESDKIELPPANTNIPEFMCGLTTSTRQESTKTTTQTQETDGNVTSKHLSSDPDRVSEAFRLAELPGKVIERDVRMINPSTRMITITKKLEDGTTVTTRNYEKIGVEPEKPFDQQAHAETQKRLNAAVDALNNKGRDETEHRSVKKDITEKVTNLQFIAEERSETERNEQIKKQQKETITQQKVTVDVDPAHDSFARSLRCVSPTESTRSVRSNSTTGRSSVSPDKFARGRRSPSRESDTSRLSTHTTTRSSRTDVSTKDYMKPTITSERKQSTFKETTTEESTTTAEAYDTVDKTKLRERSLSPKKVPQNSPDMTPRGQSPDKLARNVLPSKSPKDSTPFCSVDTSRATSPIKRDSSPTKITSAKLVRENSSESFNVDTTITISTQENKQTQHQMREDVEMIDTSKLVTENDDITVNVKLENVTDDIEVTTTVEEGDVEDKSKVTGNTETTKTTKTPKQKPPLVRSETFEERCRKILGMSGKVDSIDETTEANTSSVFSTYDNTVTRSSEVREKRKKLEQEIKSIESETLRTARKTNEFIAGERRPSAPATSPDRKASTTMPNKSTSPIRKHSQPSPERRPQQSPSKETSPVRKHSQPSPERRPKEEALVMKPTVPKESTPVRKPSQPSPDRHPKDETPFKKPTGPKESSPVRKHSQPSPDRRPKDDQRLSRKPIETEKASPVRKPSQPSPVRKPSATVNEPSPQRCSRSHERSPSPKHDISPDRKASPARTVTQTDYTAITKTTTSKADILINQKKEGKNMSVTEITIQPVIDAKKSDKVLTKQTSDTKFDRRSTSSRVVTNKSSSDFDVKRKAYMADKTESERSARTTVGKVRTPATSPEKRRPQDTSPTKSDKTKHHITVAKIKIEPVRKPVLAKVVVEDRSSKFGRTTKTTKKVVDEYTEPESDKDTGISDNEVDDEVSTVETTTTTVTTIKRTDRKDSAPVSRITGKVEKSYARSTSDNVLKSNITTKKTAATKAGTTTTTTTSSMTKKIDRPVKCVTTKTINLSAKPTIDSDNLDNVVIDIQQAKSSREPTPNKLIPIPVSPDEDTGKPRYPDAVQEPDDEHKHVPKVSNVPIFEEATNEYIGCEITEVEDHEVRAARASRITNLDRVTEDDESLMSVTQKVSKFVEEANKLKDVSSKTPNRFVRCEYDEMDEHLKSDECLLSVSDKVTKFISTAEEVKKIRTSGPFMPEVKLTVDVAESDECLKSVNEKVSKFGNVDTQRTMDRKTTTVQTTLDDMDRSFVEEDDESLLSVSEKKKKFISGTTVPQKSPELVKNVMKQTSKHEKNFDDEVSGTESETKTNITERYTTATLTKPKDKVPQSAALRSTEAVKKAKQLFENGNKPAAAELARQKDILSRPSIWEDRRRKEQTVSVTTNQKDVKLTDIGVYKKSQEKAEPEPMKEEPTEPKPETLKSRRDSAPKTPAYIKDTVSTKKDMFEKRISSSKLDTSELVKSTTSQEDRTEYTSTSKRPSITEKYERSIARDTPTPGNKPSYMNHTVSSLEHINSGRRESIDMTQRSVKVEEPVQQQDSMKTSGRYSADLKRADSGKNVVAAPTKRKSSIDCSAIEDIFELEVLEKMLESVTGYEQRRRIRAQIRLAKKSGEKPASAVATTTTTTSTTIRTNSRVREPSPKRKDSSPTRTMAMRKASQDESRVTTKTFEVEKKVEQVPRSASPTKPKPMTNGKATTATTTVTTTSKTSRFGERVAPPTKDVKDDKPIWATSNILKKASETTRSFKTTSSATTAKKTTSTMREVPKETKPTDCITSSYGVGPTDENGLPLFGIRALKKKAAPAAELETATKVTGSIFTETLYSENGSAPVGERKTTVYSSDAKDLEDMNLSSSKRSLAEVREQLLERENSRKGLISVTKTEKIGNGTSHVTTEVGALEDLHQREPKIVRKGSVKELTERFVHKESSSSLMSEKTYPKAGLILRSTQSHSSRSSTPCENVSIRSGSVDFDENDIELRTSTAKSSFRTSMAATQAEECEDGGVVFRKSQSSSSRHQTRSFLNDGSRVSGVQDVLERMRNADNVEESGDSVEDREARALLNKFLGASVLMSGMESMMANSAKEEQSTTESGTTPGTKKVSKVTTTRTVKSTASSSSNAPKPSVENLEQIWDETVLKQLLDSSTSYEDRRKIRARLRQIMAEKEACTDIVASVTADLQRERQQLQQQKSNDSSASGIHGESLLLPLLQGILLHNKSGAGSQIGTAGGGSAAVTLPIPPVEDSGTESGEDLRLLAAGLHDNIEMYRGIGVGNAAKNGDGDGSSVSNGRLPVDSGDSILHEVTAALQRLQLSLRDGKNINLESNKRNALLTLVSRLQTGLMQPDKLPDQVSPVNELADDNGDDKVDYNQARRGSARFAKRRNRNNRHTVGVSREELADARRFIEEIGRMDSLSAHSHSATPEKSKTPEKPLVPYALHKQPSLGTVLPSDPPVPAASTFAMMRPSQFVPKELNQKSDAMPLVNGRDRKARQKLFRQSQSFDQSAINGYDQAAVQHKPIDVKPAPKNEPFRKPVQTAAQRALVKKYSFNDGSTSEDDEPRKTAEQVVLQKNTAKGTTVVNTVQKIVNREVKQDNPVKSVHPSVARKTAIQRSHTPESHEIPLSPGDRPMNKYTSKKLRMKRANTIDIPKKPLSNGADSDDESEEEHHTKTKEFPSNIKTKTSGSMGSKPAPVEVPDFKPKTDNDLKFMAFLQKQNQATKQMWTNPVKEHVGTNNWTSKFDHLKNNFESAGRQGKQSAPLRNAPKNSAMNFWKKAESNSFDESHASKYAKPPKPVHMNHVAPKPPTQPRLPPKPTNSSVQQPPILPVKSKTAPQPLSKPVVVSKPEPKHLPSLSNQFTHAPTSAFKPIPKKLPPANLDFKPIHQEPEIIKPIPANVTSGLVKQLVATGFKETEEVKPEPKQVQLGLVKSLAAAGYHETPYVPLPKIERTPTHNVLNYQAQNPDRAESPTPPAPWIGKKPTEANGRVASIASTKFTANQFGMNKGSLPTQSSLTYQGSLKYNEKPLSFQASDRVLEKRPSLPDVYKASQPAAMDNFQYTFTDYTQPELVSTFTLNRSDSLTNPENQPLVLTNTNSVYSPAGQQMSYLGVSDRRNSSSLSPSNIVVPIDDDVDDLESLDSQEMRVVAKVMRAPVSQQASYSSNKTSHLNGGGGGDDRGSLIAQNLQSSLKKIQQKSPTPPNKLAIAAAAAAQKRFSQDSGSSYEGFSPYGQRSAPQFAVPKVEVTPQTPASATAQMQPPKYGVPAHVIYNNVQGVPQSRPAYQPAPLARTDSWVRLNQQATAPHALTRAKSSHTLAVPPNYEGGFGQPNRNVTDKQRTMEAYFAGQKPTFNALSKTSSSHNILRDKSGMSQNSVRPVSYALGHSYNPAQYNIMTSQHTVGGYQQQQSPMYTQRAQPMIVQEQPSQYYQPPLGGGLARSRTMPHIPMNNLSLLDENNVEDAFEELMSQSFAV